MLDLKSLVYKEIKSNIEFDFLLEKPKDRNLAHYSTPVAFSLAKTLKKSPKIIADELSFKFKDSSNLISSSINGYLNFKLNPDFLDRLVTDALKNDTSFAKGPKNDKKILLEYISANPTGPLHIGHVRGAIYGDTLQRIGNYLGYDVRTEYYINDAGNQIDLFGLSICLRAKELFGDDVIYPKDYYRGEYIDDIVKIATTKFSKSIFYDEKNYKFLGEFAKDIVLDVIKSDLKDAKIEIKNWVSEKSLYPKLKSVLKRLEDSEKAYEKDDKIWIKSTLLGDEKDRVIVRQNDNPTYLAGDIVYHADKFDRGFDSCINIWGADHHGYILRLKAALNFLGYDENRLEVILMQMVNLLKDGQVYKMSKRAGNTILMSDILNEIGVDALRFIFISKNCNTPLEFDVEELRKHDSSNPVFYINYAHARVCQIFKKANKNIDDIMNAKLEFLDEDGLNLVFEALMVSDILRDCFESRSLHKLADYLKTLASSFHKYYNENKIVGSENENAKLKLCAIVALSIKTAFSLMGIEAKDRMENF